MTETNTKRLIGVDEAASMLGVGRSLAYTWVSTGELRSIKLGRRRLIEMAEVDRFIARQVAEQTARMGG